MQSALTIYHASRLVDGAHCLATPQGTLQWLTLDDAGERFLLSSSALSLGGNIALCEESEELSRLMSLMQAALDNPAIPHLHGPRPEPTVLTTPYNPRCEACDTVRGIGQRCPQHAQPVPQVPVVEVPEPSPVESAFRDALATVVARAAQCPAIEAGRLAKAEALVLHGAVALTEDAPDGALVVSSRDGIGYAIGHGQCQCEDWQRGTVWCKHRIAGALLRRMQAFVTALTEPQPEPAPEPLPAPLPASFPEAPASVNCHLIIDGRSCQVTLRDTDETRLMARLHAFLAAHPLPPRSA